MAWLTANWFWILIGLAFIAMHLFGHGGHGGHSVGDHTRRAPAGDLVEAPARVVDRSSREHH